MSDEKKYVEVVPIDEHGRILLRDHIFLGFTHLYTLSGKKKDGEDNKNVASRIIKKKLGIDIKPERFNYIGTIPRFFDNLENEKYDKAIIMFALVTQEEIKTKEEEADEIEAIIDGKINEDRHNYFMWANLLIMLRSSETHPDLKKTLSLLLQVESINSLVSKNQPFLPRALYKLFSILNLKLSEKEEVKVFEIHKINLPVSEETIKKDALNRIYKQQ